MSDPVLHARGLRKNYPSGDRTLEVLRGVDFELRAGESVSVRGESGSGKTTFLNVLAGLDRPDAGELWWNAEATHRLSLGDLTARRGRFLGLVFQAYYLIPEIDAEANVFMGARVIGRTGAAERARAAALIKRVGLAGRAHHVPAHLSGGERQRVALARALAFDPAVLLLDEPVSAIDEASRDDLCRELRRIQRTLGVTVLHISHNRKETGLVADRVGFMKRGAIMDGPLAGEGEHA